VISILRTDLSQLMYHVGKRAVLALWIALGLVFAANAAPLECTRDDAIRSETEASTLTTWQLVFQSYKRYQQCDDGAISEGYSNSVATLLADSWDHLNELTALSRAHPGFKKFVLRHVDELMGSDQSKKIAGHIRSNCPADAARLCEEIKKRLEVSGSK